LYYKVGDEDSCQYRNFFSNKLITAKKTIPDIDAAKIAANNMMVSIRYEEIRIR
jgi:hypothetical protein